MPFLLLRDDSSASLSSLVESARNTYFSLQEYDLRLSNAQLEFISIRKPPRKINSTSTDEGFESDIDTSSIVSSDNDSFTSGKLRKNDSKPNENDSANGSDTEALESGNFEKSQEETVKSNSVPSCPKENIETFNLVDCMCYTDIKCKDILIFVIKKETFVFKFDDMNDMRNFYAKFTALKAVTNQKNYETNGGQNFNLLHKVGTSDAMVLPFKKKSDYPFSVRTDSKFMSISNPLDVRREFNDRKYPMQKESMSDFKYNTLGISLSSSNKPHIKSSSIVESLGLDITTSNLVKESNLKVWNSAEDILDSPKRPERKKKRRAPEPPAGLKEKQDIMSGQYVRVNVNLADSLNNSRVVVKTPANDVSKKSFTSMFNGKSSIKSLLKPKEKDVSRYENRVTDFYSLNRNIKPVKSWNSATFVDAAKPKQDVKVLIPVDYRYVDVHKNNNHLAFLNAQRGFVRSVYPGVGQNLELSRNLRGESNAQNINSRLFGLSSKLKNYSDGDGTKKSLWGSNSKKDMTLKSVIKGNKEEVSKKKNDKKVTFSTYTTVQVL